MQEKNILVIDDEVMHLYTAKELLESQGYRVSTYQGSFGATNQVKSLKPDLVLLDINMPALSGENLVSLIKPHCLAGNIPILFYSSNDEGTLRDLAVIHGTCGYVCKGDVPGLYRKVKECLAPRAA